MCSSRSPRPGSAPAAAPAMVTLVMSNSTSIYAICVKSNMIKHSNKLFPPETLPPRSLLLSSFGSLLQPNCQSIKRRYSRQASQFLMETILFIISTLRNSTVLLFVNPDTRDWSAQNCVGVIVRSIKYLENNETKLHYLHLEGTRNTEKKDGKFEARNFVA